MKIPADANRVFEGVIFDVYQWQQPMFDGTTATFEALKRPNTVEIIATAGDKILIADEQQPGRDRYLTLFGGRQDEGEEPLECSKRELLEEAGLESDDWQLYKVYSFAGKIEWDDYYFIARNCRKVTEPSLDGGEKIEVVTVGFDEFVEQVMSGKIVAHKDFMIELLQIKNDGEKLKTLRQNILG